MAVSKNSEKNFFATPCPHSVLPPSQGRELQVNGFGVRDVETFDVPEILQSATIRQD
jgi:hypothetical protein